MDGYVRQLIKVAPPIKIISKHSRLVHRVNRLLHGQEHVYAGITIGDRKDIQCVDFIYVLLKA